MLHRTSLFISISIDSPFSFIGLYTNIQRSAVISLHLLGRTLLNTLKGYPLVTSNG